MKIRIEIDPDIRENEVLIRCGKMDASIEKLQAILSDVGTEKRKIVFYKNDTEYYLALDEILFFETAGSEVWAHTSDDEYLVHYKLYELEELLPRNFMRVSKGAILNTDKVYSIVRNLTAASKVEFYGTHKSMYVSRSYFKALKTRLTFGIGEE